MPPDTTPGDASGRPGEARAQASAPRPRFTNVLRLPATGSTNALAADAVRGGTAEGLVVVADTQLAGRGRRSRRWVSPPEGALLCSVLFRPPDGLEQAQLLSAVVALAALRACFAVAPGPLSIKWPNDLIAPVGKVAGVLAELVELEPPAVVVGIGLNLYWPPGWPPSDQGIAELVAKAATLEQVSGRRVTRNELLDAFLAELEVAYETLLGADGRRQTLADYRAVCSTVGQEVRIETATGTFVATAVGIADNGTLEVERDGKRSTIDVGDVVHLRSVDDGRW